VQLPKPNASRVLEQRGIRTLGDEITGRDLKLLQNNPAEEGKFRGLGRHKGSLLSSYFCAPLRFVTETDESEIRKL
jgi:hypothetical protein